MADPLYELLRPHSGTLGTQSNQINSEQSVKYLSRLLSLRVGDLSTTEPQSLAQSSHSNILSVQALSSRSHRTITKSSDHLSTLSVSLQSLTNSTKEIRESIPTLDKQAVDFAKSYSKPRATRDLNDGEGTNVNAVLSARKDSQLLTRQADKLQDILELPNLLSAAIASAATSSTTQSSARGTAASSTGSANYTQALDLFAHIKRLQNIYPDSKLVKSVLAEAELAMKDMTTNLLSSLRSQNIRLAAAIRTIGWLRRVVPELTNSPYTYHQQHQPQAQQSSVQLSSATQPPSSTSFNATTSTTEADLQSEGSFGALFLTARLATFLSMTEALAPLRDLADQETEKRISVTTNTKSNKAPNTTSQQSSTNHRDSNTNTNPNTSSNNNGPTGAGTWSGHQTERYLKRYIELFREQTFSTISTYRQIFPPSSSPPQSSADKTALGDAKTQAEEDYQTSIQMPQAIASFPLHLANLLLETLNTYLPNVNDPTARESLLMQTLYAANSLGRLGADFSMMISLLYTDVDVAIKSDTEIDEATEAKEPSEKDESLETDEKPSVDEPEWVRVIKKHRVQSARLDALTAGQDQSSKRDAKDVSLK